MSARARSGVATNAHELAPSLTASTPSPPGGASFITASVSDCIVHTGYEKRNLYAR